MQSMERKARRQYIGQTMRFYVVYEVLFIVASMLGFLVACMPELIASDGTTHVIDDKINELSGALSLVALGIGALYIISARWRRTLLSAMMAAEARKKIRVDAFFAVVLLLLACQAVFTVAFTSVEAAANHFGYTTMVDARLTSGWAFFIYASFFGPFVEEVIFRGILLQRLLVFGKRFAIVTTSLLFGIFHGDLAQGVFAFCCGILLAVIAIAYSFKWAVIVHVFNNLVLAEMVPYFIERLPEMIQQGMQWLLIFIGIVGGGWVLWRWRVEILAFLQKNRTASGVYRAVWTSPWFVGALLMNIVMAAMSFSAL